MAGGYIFIECGRREIFKMHLFYVFMNSPSYIPPLQIFVLLHFKGLNLCEYLIDPLS